MKDNSKRNHGGNVAESPDKTKTAVILAGGKGTRLHPYTTSFPKPLMPVGDRPILEILVKQLARAGYGRLFFGVGHLAELIRAYFGDGTKWNVHIEYAYEDQPLGTAGPLRALADRLPPHFLVCNGDVLSDRDYGGFLDDHITGDPPRLLTISTHRRVLHSEYGVLECADNGLVQDYIEKPTYPLCVSEGVYAFSKSVLDWIPPDQRIDFPDLVKRLLRSGEPVATDEHTGLWLDIGRPDDYEKAQQLCMQHPEVFADECTGDAPVDRQPIEETIGRH